MNQLFIEIFMFKGHSEEEEEASEGEIDPTIQLRLPAQLLMIGSNEKVDLFQGFLAKHFFRGMVEVKNIQIFTTVKIHNQNTQ